MMKYKRVVSEEANDDGSKDVRWKAPNGSMVGYGYLSDKDGLVHIIRCPLGHENYMAQGICVKCGFDSNPKELR